MMPGCLLANCSIPHFKASPRGPEEWSVAKSDLDGVSEHPRLRLHCRDLGHLGFFARHLHDALNFHGDHFLDDALDLHCDDLLNDLSLTTRRQRRGPRGAKTQHPG